MIELPAYLKGESSLLAQTVGLPIGLREGSTWNAAVKFRHKGKGGFEVGVTCYLNMNGRKDYGKIQVARVTDDADWVEYGPYNVVGTITDFNGLTKDRRIDTVKELYANGLVVLSDGDADVYYVAEIESAKFDSLLADYS